MTSESSQSKKQSDRKSILARVPKPSLEFCVGVVVVLVVVVELVVVLVVVVVVVVVVDVVVVEVVVKV